LTPVALRILVADDEPHIRRVLELKLQGAGFQVRAASNGPEALAAAQEYQPDLMVSDHKMPGGMTGVELIKAVRATAGITDVPIILLTGSVAVLHELDVALAGVQRVTILSKPFSPRSLLKTVQGILDT